ncbi:CLUMA_CG006694, isoform A [Clunio marinus]|uniref:CLUMA_CG006694, isoform A n=1 Tax=Clunio marinus TaxID=568069 RepID=A0A1J1I259_9DIPT|nr:CLUMA_CG006694, isoform A [Clunio marinus]
MITVNLDSDLFDLNDEFQLVKTNKQKSVKRQITKAFMTADKTVKRQALGGAYEIMNTLFAYQQKGVKKQKLPNFETK